MQLRAALVRYFESLEFPGAGAHSDTAGAATAVMFGRYLAFLDVPAVAPAPATGSGATPTPNRLAERAALFSQLAQAGGSGSSAALLPALASSVHPLPPAMLLQMVAHLRTAD